MSSAPVFSANLKQTAPFWGVTNMETSLRFYADGLGFKMKHWWIPDRVEDKPDGRIRWYWLERGEAALMLQEFLPGQRPAQTLGTGVNVCFICEDALALYREFKSRGVQTRTRPFAGNRLLVVPVTDPDDTALNSRARPMHPRKANLKNSVGILSGSRSGVHETRRFPAATLSKSIGPRSVPKNCWL